MQHKPPPYSDHRKAKKHASDTQSRTGPTYSHKLFESCGTGGWYFKTLLCWHYHLGWKRPAASSAAMKHTKSVPIGTPTTWLACLLAHSLACMLTKAKQTYPTDDICCNAAASYISKPVANSWMPLLNNIFPDMDWMKSSQFSAQRFCTQLPGLVLPACLPACLPSWCTCISTSMICSWWLWPTNVFVLPGPHKRAEQELFNGLAKRFSWAN